MEHCGAKRNRELRKLYIEDLDIKSILLADELTDKFWYVLNRDGTLEGCIGSREYYQICEKKQIVMKKDFIYINASVGEKQRAAEIFTTNRKIRKLPVLDEEGRLLYEYVRSMEVYYEELDIQCGLNKTENNRSLRPEKITVSLTSYGKRMDTVHMAIKSVMAQTMKADAVVLYVAEEDSHRKIRQEEKLVKAGLTIVRNVKDLKSHKKYFYAVQEYPESLIVTVDDDTIYDDRLIEDLYAGYLKFPAAVICRRGHRMTKKNGKVAPYDLWERRVKSAIPENGICATGVGGILYPCGKYRK